MFWWLMCLDCMWPFRVERAGPLRCSRCGHKWIVRLEPINGHVEPSLEDECTSKKKS